MFDAGCRRHRGRGRQAAATTGTKHQPSGVRTNNRVRPKFRTTKRAYANWRAVGTTDDEDDDDDGRCSAQREQPTPDRANGVTARDGAGTEQAATASGGLVLGHVRKTRIRRACRGPKRQTSRPNDGSMTDRYYNNTHNCT